MYKNFKLQFYKLLNRQECAAISNEERFLMIISAQLLNKKETELLMVPRMDKFYIKSDDESLFIVIDSLNNESYVFVNHNLGAHIKMSQRVMNFILDKFISEVEKRRNSMEDEYRKDIQHSLNAVVSKFFKV